MPEFNAQCNECHEEKTFVYELFSELFEKFSDRTMLDCQCDGDFTVIARMDDD